MYFLNVCTFVKCIFKDFNVSVEASEMHNSKCFITKCRYIDPPCELVVRIHIYRFDLIHSSLLRLNRQ